MNISVLGIGIIGQEVARSLARSGHAPVVFNRSPEKMAHLDDIACETAATAAEAVSRTDVVLLTLADYPAIQEVLISPELDLLGKMIIQMGTIAPRESRQLHDDIRERGGRYIECPFLGSRREIQSRTVQLLIGCERELFDQHRNVFDTMSDQIYYVGAVGTASALKLALNQLIGMHAIGFSLSLGIIQRSDVDTDLFMKILRSSALYAPMADKKLANWINAQYDDPNFSAKHLLKDVGLIVEHARDNDLNTDVIKSVQSVIQQTVSHGYGELDYSSVFETIKQVPHD